MYDSIWDFEQKSTARRLRFFRKSCNRILTSSPISARGELFEHSYIEHAPSFEDLSRKKRNGFDQNDSKKMCESERVKIPSIFVFNCVNLLGYSKHPRRVMECARIRLLVAEPREKKQKTTKHGFKQPKQNQTVDRLLLSRRRGDQRT